MLSRSSERRHDGNYQDVFVANTLVDDPALLNLQLVELLDPRDVIRVEAAGGSGFGDPRARPVELIAQDLVEGYIMQKGLAAYAATIIDGAVVRQPPRKPVARSKRRTGTRRKPR
jgi:N-methylhydantoinase B/oxoprolinase/acetone carboxylase alpha subunit